MSTRKRKRSQRTKLGKKLSTVPLVGMYAGHILIGTVFLLLTLLPAGVVSILISWLPSIIDDPIYLSFAYFLHLIVLLCDGLLLVFWMFFRIVKAVKELL